MHAEISASFDNSLFVEKYQRNNKQKGLKNLRCFPTCSPRHKESGYCGRPAELRVAHPPGDSAHLACFAHFLEVKLSAPAFQVGDTASLSALMQERFVPPRSGSKH
jgi:hypothetical protein